VREAGGGRGEEGDAKAEARKPIRETWHAVPVSPLPPLPSLHPPPASPVYKKLIPFLRPHAWRMAVTIVANLLAALLDGFAIALLIPFLNILFHQPSTSMKDRKSVV